MSGLTEEAAEAAIGSACRSLHLPTVRDEAGRIAALAAKERLPHRAYLAEVLTAEVDERDGRRRARRVVEARFPRVKRLGEFDCSANPTVNPATVAALAAGAFIDAGDPLCLIGDSGTGKSHLLIGTGIAACEAGRRVRYVTCAALVNELVEAADDRVLSRTVGRYGRLDLLCLMSWATSTSTPGGPSCCSRSSPSARSGRRWPAPPTPASATGAPPLPILDWRPRSDRLTFRAHIIETGTQSYRLRTTRARAKPAKPRDGEEG